MIEASDWFWYFYFGGHVVLIAGAIWIEAGCQRLDESRARFDAELVKFLRDGDAP